MPWPLHSQYQLNRKLREGPIAGLDAVAKRKIHAPAGNLTPVVWCIA